jgi:hypothetical protein
MSSLRWFIRRTRKLQKMLRIRSSRRGYSWAKGPLNLLIRSFLVSYGS